MPEREQQRRNPERSSAEQASQDEATAPSGAQSERGDKLKADLDDLLDEIDEVLEENAEEFVRNYVQKGGQ
jgi:ubiquitin-like protein Pup